MSILTNRLGQANIGRKPPERPIEPVPEHVDTRNMHPYRGFESHGVEQTVPPTPTPTIEDKVIGHVPVQKHEPEPIPVRVVGAGGRELHDWTPQMEYANNVVRQIVTLSPERTKLTIKNIGTVVIWLGRNQNVNVGAGYPLSVNEVVTWDIQTPVWAVSNDGTLQPLVLVMFFPLALDAQSSIHAGE